MNGIHLATIIDLVTYLYYTEKVLKIWVFTQKRLLLHKR